MRTERLCLWGYRLHERCPHLEIPLPPDPPRCNATGDVLDAGRDEPIRPHARCPVRIGLSENGTSAASTQGDGDDRP